MWLMLHISNVSLLFVCWSVTAYLSTMYMPPIIPPCKKLIIGMGRSNNWWCQSTSRLLTEVELKDSEVLFPKPIWKLSVWLWELGLFLHLPHILPIPLWDVPPQHNLEADKGSGAPEKSSHYMMLGEQNSWNKVNIRLIIAWKWVFMR